jgi:phage shock protein PspC (stress-responsive transcriptional regulator)
MDTQETPQPERPEQPPGPRRLYRARDDRILAGVAGGLGRYFNVDPILFRIAAVVLTFVGGAGVLLYVAMLLLVPAEPAPGDPNATTVEQAAGSPTETRNRALMIAGIVVLLLVGWPLLLGGGVAVAVIAVPLAILVAIGVVTWWMVSGEGPSGGAGDIARRAALGIGVVIVCWAIAFAGAWAAAAGGEAVVAGIVITAGVAVLAGAFLRPVRWLILPAVVLALSAGTVSAAGIDLDGGVAHKQYRPGSIADLGGRYQLGLGDLELDLRDVDLPPGDTPLRIEVGAGEARLIVPQEVCVATRAHIGMGAVTLFGRDNGGVDVDFDQSPSASSGASRLVVDADIGAGHLDIDDDRPLDERIDRDIRREFDELDGPIDAGNAACATRG